MVSTAAGCTVGFMMVSMAFFCGDILSCSGGCYFDRGAQPCGHLPGNWAGVCGSAAREERGRHGGFEVRLVGREMQKGVWGVESVVLNLIPTFERHREARENCRLDQV